MSSLGDPRIFRIVLMWFCTMEYKEAISSFCPRWEKFEDKEKWTADKKRGAIEMSCRDCTSCSQSFYGIEYYVDPFILKLEVNGLDDYLFSGTQSFRSIFFVP